MSFSSGDKLGPYEIVSLLGAGGMGEVYKARDTRLDRTVAVKVAHEEFSERFDREARAVAALNHPNIASLYDVGPNYLVMEFVDGPTLADRMSKGAMPMDEVLPIATQMAEAIEAAHEKGIIHRDLKPENVKLTAEGSVKVLDFGLAKAALVADAALDPGNAPTIKASASIAGMIVGTPAYMSPEQASGKSVDKRTDIWAYGVVLWEMLTGKRMFEGETISHILAAVLTQQPDLKAAPAQLRTLLSRCMVKDPKQRMRDIGEARLLLAAPEEARVHAPPSVPWMLPAVASLLIAAGLGTALWIAKRPVPQPLVRLDLNMGVNLAEIPNGPNIAISPDGRRLAYLSFSGRSQLWTRRLDQEKATLLAGTDDPEGPFFSPDGQWVAYFADGKLKKISVEGGTPITLCEVNSGRGGHWGRDGNIVFSDLRVPGISRVSSSGGKPSLITEVHPQQGDVTHRWPQILPGGKAVLFTAHSKGLDFDEASIEVQRIGGGRKQLLKGGTYARLLPGGHLLYINNGTLFALQFDSSRLEVSGTAVPVATQVIYFPVSGAGQFDFSLDGKLVYLSGQAKDWVVQWLLADGKVEPLISKPGTYIYPALSPDGTRLAYRFNGTIWIHDWTMNTTARLSSQSANQLAWSEDAQFLFFSSSPRGLYFMRADGSIQPRILVSKEVPQFTLSKDSAHLAMSSRNQSGILNLVTVPVNWTSGEPVAGKEEAIATTLYAEMLPSFSPDGRWLAFTSLESGRLEVCVRQFPDTGGKWQISTEGGQFSVWSRTANELFFLGRDGRIRVADYKTVGRSFVPGTPHVWSDVRTFVTGNSRNFDLAADGKRIAALGRPPDDEGSRTQLTLIENFFDEVNRRMAQGGN